MCVYILPTVYRNWDGTCDGKHFLENNNYPFCYIITWWRHQMETFSALLTVCAGNSPVPGEFPAQRPVTRSFDVFFDLRLNKRLSKQSWGWWFETPSCPLWRHRNGISKRSGLINIKVKLVHWQLLIWIHKPIYYNTVELLKLAKLTISKLNDRGWHAQRRNTTRQLYPTFSRSTIYISPIRARYGVFLWVWSFLSPTLWSLNSSKFCVTMNRIVKGPHYILTLFFSRWD